MPARTDERPTWFLLPGGKVISAGLKGRAAEGATHSAREGDEVWTPCEHRPASPAPAPRPRDERSLI
jgi:hypothetical protein